MTIEVTIETTIARALSDVYTRVSDIESWPSWLIASGIVGVVRSAAGPIVAGERLTVEQRAGGRASTFDAEVTALEPPTRLTLHGRDGGGLSIDIEAALASAEGGTALRWSIRIGLPIRFRMFESMARPQIERAAALDVEALKRSLEWTPRAPG